MCAVCSGSLWLWYPKTSKGIQDCCVDMERGVEVCSSSTVSRQVSRPKYFLEKNFQKRWGMDNYKFVNVFSQNFNAIRYSCALVSVVPMVRMLTICHL